MSKIETLQSSARQQTAPARQRVQSTAASQAQMIESIGTLLESTALLSDELRQTARQTEAATKRAAETLTTSTQQAVRQSGEAMASLTKQIGSETRRLQEQMLESATAASQITRTLRRKTLLWAFLAGGLSGVILLSALLIWQPRLTLMYWRAAAQPVVQQRR